MNGGKQVAYSVLLFIYIGLVLLGLINHEQWRDEAQAWLIVRDTNFIEFLRVLRTEGHPPLWYLLIMPLAKLGLPYISQSILTATIMIASVYLLLFRTNLPIVLKVLLPFSYFFLYEYALFARSYCLIAFFVVAIIALYPKRFERPWLYAICIAGLFNTHVLMFTFCGSLVLVYIWEMWKENNANTRNISSAILMSISGLYLIPYLFLAKMSDEFNKSITNHTERIADIFNNGILISQNTAFAILATVLIFVLLIKTPKAAFVLVTGAVSAVYILGFKYASASYRHEGTMFFILFASASISEYYQPLKGITLNKKIQNVSLSIWLVVAITFLQLKPSVESYRADNELVFSGAKAAALFIEENELSDNILVGHQAWVASGILPFMDKAVKMYYGECRRFGTYYVYDSCYIQDKWMFPVEHSMDVAYKTFKDNITEVVLVFNYPAEAKAMKYLDLIYHTPEQPIRRDEEIFIYKFKEGLK